MNLLFQQRDTEVTITEEVLIAAAGNHNDGKGIVELLLQRRESEVTAGRYGHAVRASHAKSTGLLKGELRVLPGLPGFLRQMA